MEWDDLRYVLAASLSGSFLTAAKLLKVSHTTVGRRINALESSLGKKLFNRTRDGCSPTDACIEILPTAKRVEAEMRALRILPDAPAIEPQGMVRIHTAAWMIEHLIIPSLEEFYRRFPKIQLSFVGDVVEPRGQPEKPAFSLRFDIMAKRTEIETSFADFEYYVYARQDCDPELLPWATNYDGSLRLRTFKWLEDQNVPFTDVSLFANDAQLIVAAISAGVCKGLIPEFLGDKLPELKKVPHRSAPLVRTLRALVPRRFAASPELSVTLDFIMNSVRVYGKSD